MDKQQKFDFGKVLNNVSLRKLNAWRIGGEAEHYFSPKTLDECQKFLKYYPKEKDITWLGLGSNMLIRDHGISGCVIHTLSGMRDKFYDKSKGVFYVQAGVPCCQLFRFVARNNHHNSEFLLEFLELWEELAMNAGAHGAQLWEFVESVDVINRSGELYMLMHQIMS